MLAVVLLIAYPLLGGDRLAGPSTQATVTAAATLEQQQQCDADAKCFAERYAGDAVGPCRRSVERLAKYDFEWTDGLLGRKFSVYERHTDNPQIVTYSGDQIKFQNGFGAWQIMFYDCDYDTASGNVIEAHAYPE
jgi:hypothetical protein